MNTQTLMDKSRAYFVSQGKDWQEPATSGSLRRLNPTITISHQTGAGAAEIAGQLAQSLQNMKGTGDQRWAVYNHQIIENALAGNRWPKQFTDKLIEEKRFFVDELIYDVLDLQPPSWVLIPEVVDTTVRLAKEGHAILVGHGATVVTAELTNVFHVRLTGSLAKRIERVQKLKNLTPAVASKFVKAEDQRRKEFIKAYFHAHLDDELLYDLAVNTDRVSNEDTVALVSEAAQRFFSRQ